MQIQLLHPTCGTLPTTMRRPFAWPININAIKKQEIQLIEVLTQIYKSQINETKNEQKKQIWLYSNPSFAGVLSDGSNKDHLFIILN